MNNVLKKLNVGVNHKTRNSKRTELLKSGLKIFHIGWKQFKENGKKTQAQCLFIFYGTSAEPWQREIAGTAMSKDCVIAYSSFLRLHNLFLFSYCGYISSFRLKFHSKWRKI